MMLSHCVVRHYGRVVGGRDREREDVCVCVCDVRSVYVSGWVSV